MFGRVNNDKNQQQAAPDENVREESKLEEKLRSVQPAGNAAVPGIPPILPNIGNNAANNLLKEEQGDNFITNIISNDDLDEDDLDEIYTGPRDRAKGAGGVRKANLILSNSWMDDVFSEDGSEQPDREEEVKAPDILEEYNDYALEEDMRPRAALKNNLKNRRKRPKREKARKRVRWVKTK